MHESYSPCQIWTMDAYFVHNFIKDAFHTMKENFILIVFAFQFSSYSFIHESS